MQRRRLLQKSPSSSILECNVNNRKTQEVARKGMGGGGGYGYETQYLDTGFRSRKGGGNNMHKIASDSFWKDNFQKLSNIFFSVKVWYTNLQKKLSDLSFFSRPLQPIGSFWKIKACIALLVVHDMFWTQALRKAQGLLRALKSVWTRGLSLNY